jgi:dihydrofolate synthase/folylpolyglutamate synthase
MLTPEQARAFWYGLVNYEQRSPAATDLKLERMRTLLRRLGDPHQRLRILHVAGSKGKGSTSAMLAAILQAAGYRTGLFTSPHLVRVEERFHVNGPISEAELTQLLSEIHDQVMGSTWRADGSPATRHPPPVTFFEVATAVGLLHFVRRRVDAAVLEVGLGGRLDSTNVCEPAVAIITSISIDHTQQLGDRLGSIAREKAGIVKPRRPTVSGATAPEPRRVIEEVCRQRGSRLVQLGVDFHYAVEPGQVTAHATRRARVRVTTRRRAWPWLEVNLLGEHQAANAAVTIAAIEELQAQGWHLPDAAVAAGLAEVQWPARMEVVRRRPLVVLDCAHNVASAWAVVDTLQTSFPPARRWLVFASSGDKDIPGMFQVLGPHFAHAFLTRFTSNPRSVPPEQLAAMLQAHPSLPYSLHATSADACQAALAQAGADDLVCITGSVFLAGELRPLLVEGSALPASLEHTP